MLEDFEAFDVDFLKTLGFLIRFVLHLYDLSVFAIFFASGFYPFGVSFCIIFLFRSKVFLSQQSSSHSVLHLYDHFFATDVFIVYKKFC